MEASIYCLRSSNSASSKSIDGSGAEKRLRRWFRVELYRPGQSTWEMFAPFNQFGWATMEYDGPPASSRTTDRFAGWAAHLEAA